MNTSPYSISVYSLATLLNGVEENMSPPMYSNKERKKYLEGVQITNSPCLGYNSCVATSPLDTVPSINVQY